jgi:hypothetical protein
MIASIIICLLAHRHRLRSAPPPKPGAQRTKPPIHTQSLVRTVGAQASDIARALELRGKKAIAHWNACAVFLNGCTDPNWRSRPSVLDQMRGWKIAPAKKKRAQKPARIANASAP